MVRIKGVSNGDSCFLILFLVEKKTGIHWPSFSYSFSSQWQQFKVSPIKTTIRLFLILAILPLCLGILLEESTLVFSGFAFCTLALTFWLIRRKSSPFFQVRESGWLLLQEGKAIKDLSLNDCEEIVAEYISIQNTPLGVSSFSAFGRNMTGKILKGLLGMPVLVPNGIHLFMRNGDSYFCRCEE